ncbi:MAG: hypothetical protein M3P04_09855 [Actinomycetota bacterium]|nr:hypothetical protein [Actinomycetota bacterium]
MLTTARRSVVLAVSALVVAGSLSLPLASAAGRTFRVTTTVDAIDANPGTAPARRLRRSARCGLPRF